MSEWRDISTAPKDGTEILVYNAFDGGFYSRGGGMGVVTWQRQSFPDGREMWIAVDCCDGVTSYEHATHWMPLPPAPGETP